MSFIRTKVIHDRVRTKTYRYHQLVESYWEDGRTKQRVLAHLGKYETVEAAIVELRDKLRLLESKQRQCPEKTDLYGTVRSYTKPAQVLQTKIDNLQSRIQRLETMTNLNISFPCWDGSIEKVSYDIDDETMNMIVVPADGLLRFDDADIVFSRWNTRPVLAEERLKQLKSRRGKPVEEYIVSFPCDRGSVDWAHSLSGNYVHLILHNSNRPLAFDRERVRFNRA